MTLFLEAIGCTQRAIICISSLTLICLITLVVMPFSIYITYKFYHMRRDQAIVRRYPSALILSSILIIVYIFIIIQYLVIDQVISHRFHLWIEPIITRPYLILIILLNVLRIWLIMYDINESVIQSRQTWQSLLSSTANDKEWYSRNRLTWGNWKYLAKICTLLWILLSLFCVLPLFVTDGALPVSHALITVFSILSLSFAFGVWYMLPCFQDTFFIVQEIKIVIISSIICCILFGILAFWVEHGNIFALIQIFIIFLFVFIQIFVSEFLVIHQMNKINGNLQLTHNRSTCSLKIIGHTLFKALIASDIGIEQYMQHLQHECTTENGLFFLEMIQWMYATTDQEWDRFDISPFSPERMHYTIAKIIPISSINRDEESDWFTKIEKLYTKYVATSAEYQVNLPYSIVQEYIQLLRLYKMKKDIECGAYVAKFIKIQHTKPNLPRKTSTSFWSVSKAFSIRNRKATSNDKRVTLELDKPDVIQVAKSADAADQMSTPNMEEMGRTDPTPRIPSIIHEQNNSKPSLETAYAIAANRSGGTLHSSGGTLRSGGTLHSNGGTLRSKRKVKFKDEPRSIRQPSDTGYSLKSGDTGRSDIVRYKPPLKIQATAELETIFTDVINASVDSYLTASATPDKTDISGDEEEDSKDEEAPEVNRVETQLEQFLDVILTELSPEEDESDEMKDNALDDENNNNDNNMTLHSETAPAPAPVSVPAPIPCASDSATIKPCNIEVLDINMTSLSKHNQTLRTPGSERGSMDGRFMTPGCGMTPTLTMDTANFSTDYNVKRNLSMADRDRSPLPSIPAIGKRFTRAISVAFAGRGFTERSKSMKKPIADFVEDNEAKSQYVIDPEDLKQMELAKSINLGHFITISCFALNEVLSLNLQSVTRFRRSKYFEIFNDNVNLEQLLTSVNAPVNVAETKQISPKFSE